MAKVKNNFEKKAKVATEFDKKTPEQRVKSIKDGKVLKKKKDLPKEALKDAGTKLLKKDPEIKKKKIKGTKDDSKPVIDEGDSINRDLVEKGVVNLRIGISKELESNSNMSKNLFDDELRYGLNVVGVKIPKCPPHTRKILLKHSIYDENPDICFFITDSIPKKGDQDETVRKFKEKLEAANITNITNIMTLGQLKRDYMTHNLKLKLCHTYDIFLVESKISEHVYSILGKNFIRKRKRPFQVDTSNDTKMKISIDNAIKKSTMNISPKSLISSFEIGTAKMDNEKIIENILNAAEQLKEKWIGGWKNISRIYLRPMQPSKVSIPIYTSSIDPNDVDVPVIIGPKQQRLDKLSSKLKKNDKVKLDPKTKKISKVLPVKQKNEGENVKEEEKENKKRKNPIDKELEVPQKKRKEVNEKKMAKLNEEKQTSEVVAKVEKKKKKKDIEPEEIVKLETKEQKKKKKVEEPPAVEVNSKKKKNKKDTAQDAVIEETALIKPEKKKKVSEELPQSAVDDDVVTKPKNKKKKTAALTKAINNEKSAKAKEKDQTVANSKKKKSKKNKT